MAKDHTQLDKQLQDLASANWPQFVKLVGEANIMAAKICILRQKGQSYNQIAQKMSITFKVVRGKSEKCHCEVTAPANCF